MPVRQKKYDQQRENPEHDFGQETACFTSVLRGEAHFKGVSRRLCVQQTDVVRDFSRGHPQVSMNKRPEVPEAF